MQHNYQYLLLTTATPLNRHATDLLRLIELLDVDNLSDTDLDTLEKLRRKPLRKFAEADVKLLREFIGQFLLRRTRHELTRQIERHLQEYARPAPLHGCNYPKQKTHAYKTKETATDQRIAEQMQQEAENLVGIRDLLDLRFKSQLPSTDQRRQTPLYRQSGALGCLLGAVCYPAGAALV